MNYYSLDRLNILPYLFTGTSATNSLIGREYLITLNGMLAVVIETDNSSFSNQRINTHRFQIDRYTAALIYP